MVILEVLHYIFSGADAAADEPPIVKEQTEGQNVNLLMTQADAKCGLQRDALLY